MDYSDSIDISAPPEAAFSAVTDLVAMGRLSPENTGGEWLAGTGARLGARFKGTNVHGGSSWSTVARVTAYDAPHSFVFEVSFKMLRIARWEYAIEPTPSGCRVTEKWTDRRNALIRRFAGNDGYVREDYTKISIRTTLERLKAELESVR